MHHLEKSNAMKPIPRDLIRSDACQRKRGRGISTGRYKQTKGLNTNIVVGWADVVNEAEKEVCKTFLAHFRSFKY